MRRQPGRCIALFVALLVACSRHDAPRAGGESPALDPWAVDDPPGRVETRAAADRACPRVVAPYFFRVERAGKVSHILGTRHLGVSLAKMPDVVRVQIHAAKRAVFETPPEDDSQLPPEVAGARPSIAEQLGPALWARYRAIVGRATAAAVEHGSPSDAMIQLIALSEDRSAALDDEIERELARAGTPITGLETHAFQQRLIVELMDIRLLRATLAGTPDRATLARDAAADLAEYCAGTDDEPGFDERTRKQLMAGGYTAADIERLDDRLVYARNRDWIRPLEELFAQGDVFVAVGADHLTGPRGVIALLAARGWTVARVKP